MSTRTTRGSAAKATLIDIPNATVGIDSTTSTKSKKSTDKEPSIRRVPRPKQVAAKMQTAPAAVSLVPSKSTTKIEKPNNVKTESNDTMTPANVGKKRKRKVPPESELAQKGEEHEDLPHNLGRVKRGKISNVKEEETTQAKPKTLDPMKVSVKEEEDGVEEHKKLAESMTNGSTSGSKSTASNKATPKKKAITADGATPASKSRTKTPSKKDTYGITEGISPFPNYPRPTPEECFNVARVLRKAHPYCHPRPKTIPEPSEIIAGCGEVPSVLDAMIRTLLSAATNGRNSSNAYQGMVKRYGNRKTGVGKGSVDYNAVRLAPQIDLEKAIASGGLAKNKSKNIKAILDMVYEENQQRRKDLLDARAAGNTKNSPDSNELEESEEQKDAEIALAEENNLSLDHLYYLPTYAAIAKFTTYPGIGVKTAACVSLFCMQRDCFAVDTHVFRLCKLLGWVPDQSAPEYVKAKGEPRVDRDPTFSHLEVRIPDNLKYDLHQLFIAHGKKCPRCRGGATANSAGWQKGCPLDDLVDRTRLIKGGSPVKKATKLAGKATKKGKKAAAHDEELDEEDDVEMSDLVDDEDDDEVEEAMSELDGDAEYKSPVKTPGRKKETSSRRRS